MAQKETTKKQKSHNKREAAKLDRTSGGRSDSDVELCFDISLPFFLFFFITTPDQTCKQSGLCVSSHMALKCRRTSLSVLVFPEAL